MSIKFTNQYFFDASNHLQDIFNHYTNPWCAHQYSIPMNSIGQFVDLNESVVLDWGCGDGHFSSFLKEQDAKVIAFTLEPFTSQHRSIYNRFKSEIQFIQGSPSDAKSIPVPSENFDAVFSVGVLEHVTETGGNEIDSLKELYRILKPNGYLFIFHLPNSKSWIEFLRRTLNCFGIKKWYHQHLYNVDQINAFSNQTGFTVMKIKKYNFLPRNFSKSLPAFISHNRMFFFILFLCESFLSSLLNVFCQNFMVVLRK